MKLLGDAGAADLVTALEYERLESGFGEIVSRDEAVVASADDYDVARVRHLFLELFQSDNPRNDGRKAGSSASLGMTETCGAFGTAETVPFPLLHNNELT